MGGLSPKLKTPAQGKKFSAALKLLKTDPEAFEKKYPHSERRARAAEKMAAIKKKNTKISKLNKDYSLSKKTLLGG